jgi:hypothetical protein
MTPTSLSLRLLRRRGLLCDVVERWIPGANIRRDLFGAFDLLALDPDSTGVLAVQTTSLSNVPGRVAKLRSLSSVASWLKAGNAVQVHGWAKQGRRWTVKVVALRAEDLEPVVVEQPPRKRAKSRWQAAELFG